MRRHRITDDDAEALVTGAAPAGRPDLAPLARSITELRTAAFAAPLRPSAKLRARLELAPASRISTTASATAGAVTTDVVRRATTRRMALLGRMKRMFAWLTGLGIAAKVALGVTVAAAAGATGVGTAVGISHLASVASEHEQVAPEETPAGSDDETVVPTDVPENFGDSVSDRAHELGKDSDGAAFGQEVSEEAQQLGDDKGQDPDVTAPGTENSSGNAPELPDAVPGGDG